MPSRFRLASQACCTYSGRPLTPLAPPGWRVWPNLVAMTMLSGLPLRARPSNSSLWPQPYISELSKWSIPSSTARQIHAITVHPDDPNIVFLGTTKGAYRSTDNGGHWQRLALPDPGADVWSVTVHPKDRRTIYAGYGPTGVYRSDDGGERWTKLPDPGLPNRVHMSFACRVMRLENDPDSPDDRYGCVAGDGGVRRRERGERRGDGAADAVAFGEQ